MPSAPASIPSPEQAHLAELQGARVVPFPDRQSDGYEASESLAVPRRGHVLSSVAEFYAAPVREAVGILSRSIARKAAADTCLAMFSSHTISRHGTIVRSSDQLAAWTLAATWVTAIASKGLSIEATLHDAVRWFFRDPAISLDDALSDSAIHRAETLLRERADARAYLELTPYILDPHGPGSRLSTMRDPSTQSVQATKRAEGVFYTPADVADYMAAECLDGSRRRAPVVLDPACGTGVFLRAALKRLRAIFPDRDPATLASTHLCGVDIDPWPVSASAFVILADIWSPVREESPANLWREISRNVTCADALRLEPAGHGNELALEQVFEHIAEVPSVVLGNPPYANFGGRRDLTELARRLSVVDAKPTSTGELYLAFIEQMIRLVATNHDCCDGALVLPLSIATNVGAQFTEARRLIASTPGRWRFAFFDREPHALFGEDVKTRNAIVLWRKSAGDVKATIETGPLRKWRAGRRAAMFKTIRFTAIATDIRSGIPKLEGSIQAKALNLLEARWQRLDQAVQSMERVLLEDAGDPAGRTVFVGPTAYNFLNVFLSPPADAFPSGGNLSKHALHAIRCASRTDARAVFAILSSHLAYWWWHTNGDGFHLSRRHLAELPFGADVLSGAAGKALAGAGETLWDAIKARPIVSVNGGRISLAYSPNGHDDIRRASDEILANLVGLSSAFIDEMQQFTARSINATLHESLAGEAQ